MKQSSSLIFFGSGPVALASLDSLVKEFSIELVVTKPQQPSQKEIPIVISYCKQNNLAYITVNSKQELDTQFVGKNIESKIGIVVDFGIIISQAVIEALPLGIINSHFSLLPKLRGADPISFAILEGLTETGVSLMRIVPKMDEGPLISQESLAIEPNETTPTLTTKLITLSNNQLINMLPKYIAGSIIPFDQKVTIEPSYTRKLSKNDGIIDWQKPAQQLEREVRAFIEWPKSRAQVLGQDIIVTSARICETNLKPGEATTNNKQLIIGTSSKGLQIISLKVPGKSNMTAEAFINGYC